MIFFRIFRKEWTLEEEIHLLELVVKNGRKWSLISKILIGRNEHRIKNQYISILRLLKRNGQKLNPNKFQDVLDSYKILKKSQTPSPIRQNRITDIKPINFLNQLDNENMELESSKHSPSNQQIENDLRIRIPNPNLKMFEIEDRSDIFNNANSYRQNAKINNFYVIKESNLQINQLHSINPMPNSPSTKKSFVDLNVGTNSNFQKIKKKNAVAQNFFKLSSATDLTKQQICSQYVPEKTITPMEVIHSREPEIFFDPHY